MAKRTGWILAAAVAVTWLGWGLPASADEPPASLDELLKAYRSFGLPLPPKEAKLVRYKSGGGGLVNGEVQPKRYGLAFLLEPGTSTKRPTFLLGVLKWQPHWDPHPQEVNPAPDAVKDVDLFSEDQLALALQCHARGWDKLARDLLANSRKDADRPPEKQLGQLAWDYWTSQLTEPKSDRALAAKHLKQQLGQDKELDTEANRALLKSLELALVPSKAKPGTVEALIDGLVDYHANTGTMGLFEPEERYWRIAKLGFEAVPALIEHLDDERLTRATMTGFNNFRSWHLRVEHVVSDLLQGLAADDLGRNWLQRQQGYAVEKVEAQKWWDKARKVGEEAYALEHLVCVEGTQEQPHVSAHLLALVQAKYPKNTPSLYRNLLDKSPEVASGPLVRAVLRSSLPAKEKLELLVYGAEHKENHHRLPALRALKEVDQKEFTTHLLATIESFPEDVTEAYWRCPEPEIAKLAIEADDPRIWQTLEKVAKRSALGLRMELLNHFSGSTTAPHRPERLRLLARFLDDAALRDLASSKKFDGPCAGFMYDKLEVRDFVAMEIAPLVGIEIEQNPKRTPEEWAKIRKQVQEAVKRELDKPNPPPGGKKPSP
jgi:hypothetical protein